MKKLLVQLVIGAIVTVLSLKAVQASEASFDSLDVTYYAVSNHLKDLPFNENDHQFIGVSYNWDNGVVGSIATFNNSYFHRSIMVSWGYRWQLADNIESSINIGAVTGYVYCTVCPALEVGIKYTKYSYIQPKLSIFGDAVVLSLSARF